MILHLRYTTVGGPSWLCCLCCLLFRPCFLCLLFFGLQRLHCNTAHNCLQERNFHLSPSLSLDQSTRPEKANALDMQFQLRPASLVLLFGPQVLLVSAQASTITQTAVSTLMPTSSQYTSDSDFQNALLTAHNFFRMEHNASALTWNDTSASYGANWANGCAFKHSVSS
jgi:uncharacterized protein YkwD